MKWIYLLVAILLEVAGSIMMKLSDSFTKLLYSVGVFMCYAGSLIFLTLALKYFEISVVYAVWSGVGVAILAIVGVFYFNEKMDLVKAVSLVLVVIGVIGLNLSRK